MRRITDVLFVAPLLLGVVVAQVSVPNRPNGLAYMKGDSSAPVQIDLFVDLMCPDSKLVFPVLLKVAEVYGPPQSSSAYSPVPSAVPQKRILGVTGKIRVQRGRGGGGGGGGGGLERVRFV